jgi:hypothetical protein
MGSTVMLASLSPMELAGQLVSLTALVLCLIAFASKQDQRLMVWLLAANVAFALQFALFQSWTASVLTLIVILRIILARRYPGNLWLLGVILALNMAGAWVTWQSWHDLFALLAGTLGTLGMFLLRGIPMRLMLGAAALCWMTSNILIGSVGATLAEGLVLVTNAITIWRLHRLKQQYPDLGHPPAGS